MVKPEGDVEPIETLIRQFARLPGIGLKTASRLVYHLLQTERSQMKELAGALLAVADKVRLCSICFMPTQNDPCKYCSDPKRDDNLICVVERPQDLIAIEKSGEFRGRYHILHGKIAPLSGIGPDDLKISELLRRLEGGDIAEVIIATNPNGEGEATAIYLSKLIKPLDIKVTRIASGIPMGGELEYIDKVTLARALSARREL
ncbi:MAG: recombination mediator RecR [Myxococcota bacterium]